MSPRDRGPAVKDAGAGDAVGGRIRELRQQRGLTVRGLAGDTGLSVGLISQVERGLTDPSLETLRRIGQALEVPIFGLFGGPKDQQAAVVRKKSRMRVSSPHSGVTYTRISKGAGRIEMLEGTLDPGGASSAVPWSHPSEECVLVAKGRLVVEVGGERHALAPGDSCYFDSRTPHRYLNETLRPVTYVLAITPPSY
ncbi:MAG: cupin domain-containing protein [Streptosporangiales bacterium]|nr:cupin domain-containing protein [Streptosporangiales bacterium]MBO0890921.1 cupin domain-containing protein [Acidothermales bacterium]